MTSLQERLRARFDGVPVLVAGGARGMGAEIARRAAEEGAFVAVGDVRDEEARAVAAELGGRGIAVPLDVTSAASWADAVAAAEAAAGAPVRVLVQTAGIVRREPIAATAPESFGRLLAVNLIGPFLGIQAAVGAMRRAGGGSVVVVSSINALAGAPGYTSYCASKAGVTGLVKAAAVELAPEGIRVNALAPGTVDTPMIRGRDGDAAFLDALAAQVPARRPGTPADIASAALFLASDDASYISGTTLIVDGGVMAQVPLQLPG